MNNIKKATKMQKPKPRTEWVSISDLENGHTVMIDGEMKTVSGKFIKTGGLHGATLYGDCHYKTDGKVEKVFFPKCFDGEHVGWFDK